MGPIWLGIAAVLVVYNIVLIGFGVTNPALTGYGTFTDMWIGVAVLVGSVLLYGESHRSRRTTAAAGVVPPAVTLSQLTPLAVVAAAV